MTKFYTNFDIRKTLKFEKVLKHLLTTLLLFFILLANTAQVSAQIAQRGAATTASSTGNTIAINKPTGVVPGDIMIATIAQRASTGNTLGHAVLAGWTQIASSNLGANTTWGTVLYRIAAIGEPVNYTFTLDNQNNGATGAIIAFSGVDNVNPLDVTPNTLNVNTNTVASAATKTTTTTNAAVVMLVMSSLDAPTFNNNWNTATSPGALTELFDAQNTSARSAVGGAWALKPTIGATGTGTVTMSSNERYGAVILLLRKALPIITSFTATSACAGSGASITINGHHFSGATSVAFNGTAATYFINSSNQITATLPAGATSGTITVTTPAGTGTSATSFTVNALPVVAALTGNTNVCVNSSTAFSSTTPGGVWTSSSNAIATVVGGTVTGVSAGTATISYAVTTSGCTTTVTKTITVDALPTVSGPSSVCMGSTIQMMPNTGGTWSSSNNAFATIDNTGLVTPVAPGSVTFTFTNSTTNCSRTTSSVAINVAPSISFHPSSQVRCSGPATTVSFSVTAGGTGITYLWYKDGNPMSNGGNISGATTQTLTISPIAIGDAANYHCVVTGVCSPAAASNVATLSVNERIVITSQPATTQTHCSGGTATFAVTATGTTPTFQWYKNGSPLSDIGNILGSSTATLTISPLVSGDASANYYCIVSGVGSCSPVTSNNAALVINEGPAISAEPAATQTVCAGATVSFTVGATGGNLVYQWYKGASPLSNGPLISGVSTQTLTISNTVPSDSAPDYYCVVSNGCATPATTINAQLIVNDRPFIQNYTTAVCSTATFSVTPVNGVPTVGTVVPTGTTYTWGVPSMAPGLTGGMAGTNQSVISGTLVNSTNGDLTAVYTVTPTSGTAGNCTGNTFTVTVTVNPMPFVINSTASTCSGIPLSYTPSNGGGNIVPVGTTYSWSSPTVSGGMTGGASGTNQTAIHVNLNNPTNTVQTASYNVTATSGTCVGSTFTLVVNINPRPTAAGDIPTQSICSGAAISTITISNPNNVAGTIYYSWTRDNTVNVTGIAASGSTSTISGNLTNITNAPQTVTFQLYATSDQSCVSVGVPVTVVINPVPTVVATPSTQTICSGVNTTAVNFTSNGIAGTTTFIWSRDKNAEVTGLLPNGNGPIAATALTNTTNVQQIITFTVYATNSGCDSPTSTFTITVNPRPDISAIPTGQTLCGGSPFAQIDASNPNGVAGTTFSWTRNNTVNLTGYANSGTGATIPAGTFQNNTNVDQTATFTITATAAGCAITTTATVLVHPTPLAVATPASQNRCNGVAIANINLSTTNNMSNITYTWTRDKITELTGIANSGSGSIASGSSPIITGALTNTTSITQTATFTIVVTGPAPNFCSRTITATVTVYAPFIAPIIGDTQTACEFSTPAALTMTTLPTGGSGVFTYQWQRSANGTTGWANIGGATGVTYTPGFVTQTWYYRLIITDTAGCAPSPITTNSVLIQMASSSGLTFNASGFPNAAICPGTSFTPSLSAVHGDDAAIRFTWSANSTYITPGTGGPIGTTGNRFWILVWLRTSTGNFNFTAQNNTNASVTVPITITPHLYDYDGSNLGAFQCTLTPQIRDVTILPRPIAYASIPAPAICSGTGPNIQVTGNITDANMSFSWTRNNTVSVTGANSGTSGTIAVGGTYTITNALNNNTGVDQVVTYTITPISNGCNGTPITINVTVAPAVTPGTVVANQTICSGDLPAGFTQTVAATGNNLSYQWQLSTNGGVTYTNIPSANSATYTHLTPITQTTYFIRVVSSTLNSFTCSAANTTPIIVTVNAITPGSLNENFTICSGGSTPTALGATATGSVNATGSGTISYEWEYSTAGCGGPWTVIGGATLATYTPTGLTDNTYFRRKGKSLLNSVTCSSYSNCIMVIVNKVTGGTVGSDQALCGNNPDAFTQTVASTGSGVLTYQWQISTNNVTFTNISGANGTTYDPPAGVTVTTYYIRITTSTLNSVVCTAQSNTITVTPNTVTPGVISGNRTVCHGGNPAAFTVLVPATGTNITYQWQYSTAGGAGPWTDISGATNDTYDENGPVNATTYYQCVVTATLNGSPCSAATNFVTVFVNSINASTTFGTQSVCGVQVPTTLTGTTVTGSGTITYQWQRSTVDCNSGWTNIPGATGTSYSPSLLTQTTYYQLVTTSTLNAVACSEASNCVVVTVNSKIWNGLVSSDWTNPANWSGNTIPTSADCVVIPTAPNVAIISGTNYGAFAYNITITTGTLRIETSNNLTATDVVNVYPTGQFFIMDSANLIQVNNVANIGRMNMERITKPMYRFDFTYWGSPVTFASNFTLGNAGGLSPGTLSDKFFSWTPTISNGIGGWAYETAATVMNPIKGYIVRAPQTFSFTPDVKVPYTAHFIGTPNNGDIFCPIYHGTLGPGNNNDKYNLLGNPYPSAVDAEAFLSDPANVPILDGTIYFWTHNSAPSTTYVDPFYGDFVINYTATDYASWNKLGGTGTTQAATTGGATPTGHIAAGQGFFAKSTGTAPSGNTAVFKNSMRLSGNNNQFFRVASSQSLEKHRIWLNLVNNVSGGLNQILVGYVEGATNDWDRDFDGTRISETGMTLYSVIPNYNLVIQGRPLPFNTEDQVPLGCKITVDGSYSIRIDHIDGLFDNQNIYLEDKVLNVIHNLKTSPYSFTSATGTFNDRFVLRYTDNQLGVENPNLSNHAIALIADGKLQIQASENIREVGVFDLAGKLLRKYEPGSLRKTFAVDFNFSEGIYLVKIKFDNGTTATEKLIHKK